LLIRGGRIRFAGATYVAQEAVAGMRQLVRQRARWVQGHLVAWEHLGEILRSGARFRVRLDLTIFLLLPVALVPVALATVKGWQVFVSSLNQQSMGALLAWYAFAFASAPLTIWVLTATGTPARRAVVQAHLFLIYGFFWVIAAFGAIWAIMRGDRSWAKTSRAVSTPARRQPRVRLTRHAIPVAAALSLLASSTLLMAMAASSAIETYSRATSQDESLVTTTADERLGTR
jgi:cellulose synthase/poly-beta-1,6-N-acetylglucosamine synthase-like glycosyltransferase